MADNAAERLEREEFEAWAIERNMALTLSEGTVDELAATNRAWHTWKAAWQAARRAPAEAGANCDRLIRDYVSGLLANDTEMAGVATRSMVDYVFATAPASTKRYQD